MDFPGGLGDTWRGWVKEMVVAPTAEVPAAEAGRPEGWGPGRSGKSDQRSQDWNTAGWCASYSYRWGRLCWFLAHARGT